MADGAAPAGNGAGASCGGGHRARRRATAAAAGALRGVCLRYARQRRRHAKHDVWRRARGGAQPHVLRRGAARGGCSVAGEEGRRARRARTLAARAGVGRGLAVGGGGRLPAPGRVRAAPALGACAAVARGGCAARGPQRHHTDSTASNALEKGGRGGRPLGAPAPAASTPIQQGAHSQHTPTLLPPARVPLRAPPGGPPRAGP